MTGTSAYFINGRLPSGAQPLEKFVHVRARELGGAGGAVPGQLIHPQRRTSSTASQPATAVTSVKVRLAVRSLSETANTAWRSPGSLAS